MAIQYIYDQTWDIRGWWGPTLTLSGWFDKDWTEATESSPNYSCFPNPFPLLGVGKAA